MKKTNSILKHYYIYLSVVFSLVSLLTFSHLFSQLFPPTIHAGARMSAQSSVGHTSQDLCICHEMFFIAGSLTGDEEPFPELQELGSWFSSRVVSLGPEKSLLGGSIFSNGLGTFLAGSAVRIFIGCSVYLTCWLHVGDWKPWVASGTSQFFYIRGALLCLFTFLKCCNDYQ